MDGTETNWDSRNHTSAHILFINGLKIVRGEDYTVLGSYTYRVPFRSRHVQESYSGSILVGSGGGGGFQS
jgi:hypothetical protein